MTVTKITLHNFLFFYFFFTIMDYEDDNPTSNDDDINTLLSTSSYDDDITHGISEKLQSKIIHPINVIHSIICGKISNEEWNESIHSIHHQQTQEIANTFAECKQFFQAFQKQSTEFNQLIEETKKSSDENNDDISVILKNILKSDSFNLLTTPLRSCGDKPRQYTLTAVDTEDTATVVTSLQNELSGKE